jgi:hypothetical protein
MIEKLVAHAIISFILGQLEKLKGQIDWDQLKAKLDQHVRDLVPGTWFDDAAVKFCDSIFAALRGVLDSGDTIKSLLELLAEQKYDEALAMLKDLLLGQIGHMVAMEGKEASFKEMLA